MSVRNLLHPPRGRVHPAPLATVLLAVALLAAGCGGAGSGSTSGKSEGVASLGSGANAATATTRAGASTADRERQLLEFAKCMRQHGVNMPDPTVDAKGNVRLQPPTGASRPSQAILDKARTACQQHLEGVTQGFSEQDQTRLRDALVDYAQCMRKNGYDMPDPNFSSSGGGAGGLFGGRIDRDDPAFKKADQACGSHLAQLPGRGGGS
jgi:hypothetical protein